MGLTMRLYSEIEKMKFEVEKPILNIVVFTHEQVDKIAEKLTARGWAISRTRRGEIRLVIMPHVTEESIDNFVKDLKEIVEA